MQSPDSGELPVLELDLGWQLPDFAAIGMCDVICIYMYDEYCIVDVVNKFLSLLVFVIHTII